MSSRRQDLNLLLALNALLQERSVTRAADKLGLAQPTLSASLARLRRHFDDELLVRFGNEYRLTPLAVRLRDRAEIALGEADRVFHSRADFDPSRSTREFKLLASDYAQTVIGGPLADLLAREAPGTRLRFTSITTAVLDTLEQSLLTHDLLLLPHGFVADMPYQDVFEDEWMCLVASSNDAVGESLTVEDLRRLPWVVSYSGPTAATPAWRQIRMAGIEPRPQVVTENFLSVPDLVAGSPRIALLQKRLVNRLGARSDVRALPCPFPAGRLVEGMWWHPGKGDEPESLYLRQSILSALKH
ncbi:LysR family transcriptional regulator [Streptomyces sp. NPDC005485]|uniref:LysR family transcriptional regulator n=1 Tax=Streptomyces sp. NPDC005485 TaxID=3155591 RepID=UPI0033AEC581